MTPRVNSLKPVLMRALMYNMSVGRQENHPWTNSESSSYNTKLDDLRKIFVLQVLVSVERISVY